MVPSRSRKTAGRSRDCSDTLHPDRRQQRFCRSFYNIGSDRGHAPMISRAAAQKTWAAVWLLLNDAAARRDGSRPKWISGTKHRDDRQAYSSGNVHGARIIANEKMAPG